MVKNVVLVMVAPCGWDPENRVVWSGTRIFTGEFTGLLWNDKVSTCQVPEEFANGGMHYALLSVDNPTPYENLSSIPDVVTFTEAKVICMGAFIAPLRLVLPEALFTKVSPKQLVIVVCTEAASDHIWKMSWHGPLAGAMHGMLWNKDTSLEVFCREADMVKDPHYALVFIEAYVPAARDRMIIFTKADYCFGGKLPPPAERESWWNGSENSPAVPA